VGMDCGVRNMEPVVNIRFTRNGGMNFLRIGRLQTSWCICSTVSTNKAFPVKGRFVVPPILDCHDYKLATPRQYAAAFE
jgi:hypothetical protein